MKFIIILFTLTVITLSAFAKENMKPTIKIGIKKRAKNCEVKARKGDTIHVHYRVRFIHIWIDFSITSVCS